MQIGKLAKHLLTLCVLATGAQAWQSPRSFLIEERLVAPDPSSAFGAACGFDAPRAYSGAPFATSGGVDGGLVFVHRNSLGHWLLEAVLAPPAPQSGAQFGSALDADSGRVAVGASWEDGTFADQGAVHVFQGVSGPKRLVAPSPSAWGRFGASVAIDGSVLVVGEPFGDYGGISQGAAHVYRLSGTDWVLEQTLLPSDPKDDSKFGWSVDIQGDTCAVGAIHASGQSWVSGAAYVFRRSGGAWTQQSKLIPYLGGPTSIQFGFDIALDLPYVVVTESAWAGWTHGGAAHVWYDAGGEWHHEAALAPPGVQSADEFGSSVAIVGTTVFVGAPGDSERAPRAGAAYAYELEPANWHFVEKLLAVDGGAQDAFGRCVASDGFNVLLGAPSAVTDAFPVGGATYVYTYRDPPLIGDMFCVGDGTDGPCRCGNESDVGWCMGCRNSTGEGARLVAVGSASVAARDLEFHCRRLPPWRVGFAVVALGAQPGGLPLLVGDGLSCLGSPRARSWPVWSDGGGFAGWSRIDWIAPEWIAGTTLYSQVWYRDASSPCGHSTNLSNGLAVTLTN